MTIFKSQINHKQLSSLRSVLVYVVVTTAIVITALLYYYLPSSSSVSLYGKQDYDFTKHVSTIRSNSHPALVTKIQYSVRFNTRRHPAINDLDVRYRADHSMPAKFRSLSPTPLKMWFEDGRGGSEQSHLRLGQETTTNTYEGHVFFFTDAKDKNREIARYTMSKDKALYIIEDPDYPPPTKMKLESDKEEYYMSEYFEKTGILWRHFYGPLGPRPPPSHFMWPANSVGEVHQVKSSNPYWTCDGTAKECQGNQDIILELEVVSIQPRAFVIEHFLSDFEASEVVRLAEPKMGNSIVGDIETGAFESETRTSRNGWLARSSSPVIETLFRRAADLIQIDERHLHRTIAAEDMQVVHYEHGQRYDSHHDWGVSGFVESRYITLLLYLNDMKHPHAGGETAFPKGADGKGLKIHPGKGGAVMFYNLLPDGNGDDLSLHAALPVHDGEKWLANFWVWDPKIK